MKRIFIILKGFFIAVGALAALWAGFQYLYCPVYNFPEPKPFSGDAVYNPYADMDSTKWRKANFHLHTRRWGGVTNGSQTSDKIADSIYSYLGYDIPGISDYQHINHLRAGDNGFVPMYEHGYMFPKNHQIVIGAKKVSWLDYPFPQTLNNKQHVILSLKKDTTCAVAVAHPNMRKSYSTNDFKYLSGYDCIEIFDRIIYSVEHWDTALSAGHPAFATSVDDNHNINDLDEVAVNFTLVNSDLDERSVIDALKKGRMISCEMNLQRHNNYDQKKIAASNLPVIKNVAFENNRLSVSADRPMNYIKYIGQDGALRKLVSDTAQAAYDFTEEDTYIRTEIHFADSIVYYLNPVFRYSNLTLNSSMTINESKTLFNRILFFSILLLSIVFIYRKKITRRATV